MSIVSLCSVFIEKCLFQPRWCHLLQRLCDIFNFFKNNMCHIIEYIFITFAATCSALYQINIMLCP